MSELGQKIIAEVRKVADANPFFVYPREALTSCQYLRDGQPSCLIGHALWNLNLINSDWDGDNWSLSDISHVVKRMDWPLETGEIEWLYLAQQSQDSGYDWARSILRADRRLPEDCE